MKNKTEVSLIVSDVDNTIIDLFDNWAKTTKKAFDSLCKSREIDFETLKKDVMSNTPLIARIHDLALMIRTTPVLQPKNESERKKFAKDDAKIIHEWEKGRDEPQFYEGVIATIRKAKSAGAKFVLYSDGPVTAVVARLAKRNFPTELIDGIYAQPDTKIGGGIKYPLNVQNKIEAFYKAMNGKVVSLDGYPHKPQPDVLNLILKDMKIDDPKNAVMVGDHVRSDCGAGNMAGMKSAWQRDGADLKQETIDFYYSMPINPKYPLGLEKMSKVLDENPFCKPTVILEAGFKELDKHFKFVSPDKLKTITAENAIDKKSKVENIFDATILMARKRGHE